MLQIRWDDVSNSVVQCFNSVTRYLEQDTANAFSYNRLKNYLLLQRVLDSQSCTPKSCFVFVSSLRKLAMLELLCTFFFQDISINTLLQMSKKATYYCTFGIFKYAIYLIVYDRQNYVCTNRNQT